MQKILSRALYCSFVLLTTGLLFNLYSHSRFSYTLVYQGIATGALDEVRRSFIELQRADRHQAVTLTSFGATLFFIFAGWSRLWARWRRRDCRLSLFPEVFALAGFYIGYIFFALRQIHTWLPFENGILFPEVGWQQNSRLRLVFERQNLALSELFMLMVAPGFGGLFGLSILLAVRVRKENRLLSLRVLLGTGAVSIAVFFSGVAAAHPRGVLADFFREMSLAGRSDALFEYVQRAMFEETDSQKHLFCCS